MIAMEGTMYVLMTKNDDTEWHPHSIYETRQRAETVVSEFMKIEKDAGIQGTQYKICEFFVSK